MYNLSNIAYRGNLKISKPLSVAGPGLYKNIYYLHEHYATLLNRLCGNARGKLAGKQM
jgi:hypothetical protein